MSENFGKILKIRRKQTLFATALILLLTLSVFAAIIPAAQAHTPAWSFPTYAYVSAVPNPVGVGQPVTIVFWLDKVPPTAGGSGGDRWRNLSIGVTAPDGTKQTLGPFFSDPVGGTYTIYTPSQVGKYTFVFTFPGQVVSLYGPTGIIGGASDNINDTYQPSTASATLNVQQSPISSPLDYPLPTAYWTRPIEGENAAWGTIASNWLSTPQIVGKFQVDGIGPNSPHIMWTKPLLDGGLVGGNYSGDNSITFYDGSQYELKIQSPIIMNGRLFYALPNGEATAGNGYLCVDLATGETLYWQNITQPTMGQFYDYESPNQHGVIPNGYLWRSVTDANNGGTVWMAYDPPTGNWLFNLTNVPSGTLNYGQNGEILIYQLNYTGRWLALWNNTAAPGELNGLSGTNFWQWRPIGKNINASTAYSWNVTIPSLPGMSLTPAISKILPGDMLLGTEGTFGGIGTTAAPANLGGTVFAISLNPSSRGSLLWIKNYTAPLGNLTRSLSAVDPVNRVFIMFDKETQQWTGFSIDDGRLLWGPTKMEDPWNFYSGAGGALMTTTIAYGKLFSTGYSGIVYCYDTKNGTLLWNYTETSGLNSPYPGYPLGIAGIADGKLYLNTNEHSCSAPYWKGAKMRCLDINTGKELWTLLSHGTSSYGAYGYAIADGNLVYLNLYDNQMYCIGKGPSATTVTGPDVAVSLGTSVMIRGTVTDQTPAAKDTPAISDENMGDWMAYLYMQKARPTNATGVQVKLTAIDPNGNTEDIGTVTSDTNGKYGFMWTPPLQGTYKVIATFAGSNSYWGSDDTTYIGVSKAQQATPTVTTPPTVAPTAPATVPPTSAPASPSPSTASPPTAAGLSTTFYVAVSSAIVVIVVVAAAAFILRKRR